MITQAAVVLAAGKGTRMNSQIPKVLHRICGVEMVTLVVESARAASLDPIVVVVPRSDSAIRDVLKSKVAYAEQGEPLGSGHALLQAERFLRHTDEVLVLSGDVPLMSSETLRTLLDHHRKSNACITLLVSTATRPDGLGRIVRSPSGDIVAIVEEVDADEKTRSMDEINGGVYCFRSPWLWKNLGTPSPVTSGEVRLTDLVAVAAQQGMPVESVEPRFGYEAQGVNTRIELAQAEAVLRERIRQRWMLAGVTISDPPSVYIDSGVELGQDTVLLPNTHVSGNTRIGRDCEIGPNSIVSNSQIGDRCKITASVVEDSTVEEEVEVGPFSRVRGGAHLERGVYLGTHAEVKNSRLGPGTKSAHFSFIGDADVGANVNIGAGTVTCNYDGVRKNKTTIGEGAFIGSDSMLVAPVEVGPRSSTGAGSVVTKDVPPDSTVVGVPARVLPKKRDRSKKE
jgi:bifunctional UDP-N-acetylglucosamine pyrophosphorylase/glucosamine-1-phosphate N-acetyltransferase